MAAKKPRPASKRIARGPLHGIRVLDTASFLAGPFGATLLGDFGADVIKIESPAGEESRHLGPERAGERSPFIALNRNKRDVVLDLERPAARRVLQRLIATADVLITNVREPALSRMGLAYESVRKHRRDIVWVGVTAFGADGPYAGRAGIDFLAQGFAGLVAQNGEPDGRPLRVSVPLIDIMTSLLVSNGVLIALHDRAQSGRGQRIDISLLDALVHAQCTGLANMFFSGTPPPRVGNRSMYFAPSGVYPCADGKHICITCPTQKFFRNLCAALGTGWADDERYRTIASRMEHEEALDAEIAARCRAMPRDKLLAKLTAADVMAAPVNNLADVARDPQVRHNGMITTAQHTTAGTIKLTGVPIHLQRTPGSVRRAPPVLGEHTAEVLRELGYKPREIEALAGEGAVVAWEQPKRRRTTRR